MHIAIFYVGEKLPCSIYPVCASAGPQKFHPNQSSRPWEKKEVFFINVSTGKKSIVIEWCINFLPTPTVLQTTAKTGFKPAEQMLNKLKGNCTDVLLKGNSIRDEKVVVFPRPFLFLFMVGSSQYIDLKKEEEAESERGVSRCLKGGLKLGLMNVNRRPNHHTCNDSWKAGASLLTIHLPPRHTCINPHLIPRRKSGFPVCGTQMRKTVLILFCSVKLFKVNQRLSWQERKKSSASAVASKDPWNVFSSGFTLKEMPDFMGVLVRTGRAAIIIVIVTHTSPIHMLLILTGSLSGGAGGVNTNVCTFVPKRKRLALSPQENSNTWGCERIVVLLKSADGDAQVDQNVQPGAAPPTIRDLPTSIFSVIWLAWTCGSGGPSLEENRVRAGQVPNASDNCVTSSGFRCDGSSETKLYKVTFNDLWRDPTFPSYFRVASGLHRKRFHISQVVCFSWMILFNILWNPPGFSTLWNNCIFF